MMNIIYSFYLIVALPSFVSGFTPLFPRLSPTSKGSILDHRPPHHKLPLSLDPSQHPKLEDRIEGRAEDVKQGARDVTGLLRDVGAYVREWLPPLGDEDMDMVKPDFEGIGNDLESSETVRITVKRNWLQRSIFIGFEPCLENAKDVGFCFYPGALVRAEAYAPMCRALAERGYYAVLLTPPLLLSLADVDVANIPLEYYGDAVKSWAVSGHSMGVVVSASYANQHVSPKLADKLKAVILLASYPSALPDLISAGDLSDDSYDTTSIYGSLDGLTTLPFIEASKALLPANANYVCIDGGNHSQFYYGKELQPFDNPATITRDEQQEITLQNICQILERISPEEEKAAP